MHMRCKMYLTIQFFFQRATLLQQCKEQYIEAEIDLSQTRWNTKFKIQNYCKLGGIQNAKYKPVGNCVEFKMQTIANTKLLQTRCNTKHEIELKNKICLENTRLGASQKGERLFQLFIITGLPLPQKGLPCRILQMR